MFAIQPVQFVSGAHCSLMGMGSAPSGRVSPMAMERGHSFSELLIFLLLPFWFFHLLCGVRMVFRVAVVLVIVVRPYGSVPVSLSPVSRGVLTFLLW